MTRLSMCRPSTFITGVSGTPPLFTEVVLTRMRPSPVADTTAFDRTTGATTSWQPIANGEVRVLMTIFEQGAVRLAKLPAQ